MLTAVFPNHHNQPHALMVTPWLKSCCHKQVSDELGSDLCEQTSDPSGRRFPFLIFLKIPTGAKKSTENDLLCYFFRFRRKVSGPIAWRFVKYPLSQLEREISVWKRESCQSPAEMLFTRNNKTKLQCGSGSAECEWFSSMKHDPDLADSQQQHKDEPGCWHSVLLDGASSLVHLGWAAASRTSPASEKSPKWLIESGSIRNFLHFNWRVKFALRSMIMIILSLPDRSVTHCRRQPEWGRLQICPAKDFASLFLFENGHHFTFRLPCQVLSSCPSFGFVLGVTNPFPRAPYLARTNTSWASMLRTTLMSL